MENSAGVAEVVEVSGSWGIVGGGWLLLSMPSKELAEEGAKQINKALAPLVAKAASADRLGEALKPFVEAFEIDFVTRSGEIVDSPEKLWGPLVEIYRKHKAALALHEEAKKGKQ